MSKSSDIFGISKLEMGDPGDGVPGTTLVEFNDIQEASASLMLPKSETTKVFSEVQRKVAYRVIDAGNPETIKIELKFLGLAIEDWPKFFGGTVAAGKWTAPKTSSSIYQTVRLTSKPTDAAGTVLVFEMAYALVTAGIDDPMTYNALTPITVTFEAMVPVSALGAEGDPFTVEEV